jgi:hypothetical protein
MAWRGNAIDDCHLHLRCLSVEEVFDNRSAKLAELFKSPRVAGPELVIIQAQKSQQSDLKARGEVTVTTACSATLRVADFGQNDKSGKVLLERPKPSVHPSTNPRIPAEAPAS